MQSILNTFVGRNEERTAWAKILAEQSSSEYHSGQAVVIVGKYGMGKTRLLDLMVADAEQNKTLQCVALRYSVTTNESPSMVMKMMLEDAFQAARYEAGLLDAEGKRFFQWNQFYRKFGFFADTNDPNYELLHTLRYDDRKNIFKQFIFRLRILNNLLPKNGRLLIVIDPEQDTPTVRVEQWSQIVRELPPKVNFLFAQRFKDTLAMNEEFRSLENVHFLPPFSSPQGLPDLSDSDTQQLIEAYQPLLLEHLPNYQKSFQELSEELHGIFHRYRNHPYAVHAMLDLLLCKNIDDVGKLPCEPMAHRIAETQWKQIIKHPLAHNARFLFEAYSVLEVPSLDEMVCWVADISFESLKAILADPFLRSMIRDEPDGRLIYHHYLNAYIRSFLYKQDGTLTLEAERLHQRAMTGYGELMQRSLKPDPLATVRLPEHSLAIGGPELFADTLGHCSDAFFSLGFYQTFGTFLERALALITPGSVKESDLLFQFGQLRYRQGDLNIAVEYYERSLLIARNIIEPERIAVALFALGKIAYEQHRFADVENYLREAIVYYESGSDQTSFVETLLLLGEVLWHREKVEESEIAFEQADKVAAEIKNYRQKAKSLAAVLTARGRILDECGNRVLAAELYHKALDLTQKFYDREAEAEIHFKLCSLFERSGNLKKAEENLSHAMQIHQELTLVEQWAEDNFRLARLAQKQGNTEHAQERLMLARKLYCQLGNSLKIEEIDAEKLLGDS